MKRTLVTCGWLVTGDDRLGDFRNGELLLAGNRIEAVGRNLGATADETIDASDKIVMPGLVNAHMHTWQTGLRGIAGDWMSPEYMQNIHGNLGTRYTPEDNYLGNLMGALAQIDGGERGARQRAVCEDARTLDRGAALGARRRRPRFHIEDRIGTLSPGKKADLVMLRAADLNLFPVHDPVQSVVELAAPATSIPSLSMAWCASATDGCFSPPT